MGPPAFSDPATPPRMSVIHRCGKVLWNLRWPWRCLIRKRGGPGRPFSIERARELPETTFLMWFTDVRPIGLHEEVLSLAVPSQFVRERLQHNHLGLIEEAAEEAFGRPVKIEMEVDEAIRHEEGPLVDLDLRAAGRLRGDRRAARSGAHRGQAAARSARPPVPQLHLRRVRAGSVQPVRARGRDGRRRGAAVDRVQPAVHLRRHGPRARPTCSSRSDITSGD